MRDAFAPLDPTGACLFVLTLDRRGTYSGEMPWENAQEAYRDLGRLSAAFLKRLRKWMISQGWEPLGKSWVATVEAHKSGWPHVNFVIWSKELADWLEDEKKAKMRDRISEHDSRFVAGPLADVVVDSGWGLRSTAERARSREESLGYICKVAGKVDESIGELAKLSQVPTNAPFRFRRLRAGKGFLPARAKSAEFTGTLIRRQHSNDGTRDAVPLHSCPAAAVAHSEECCETEERIWIDELSTAVRCVRQVRQFGMRAVQVPAVTRWKDRRRFDPSPFEKGSHVAIENDNELHRSTVIIS